MGKHVFNVVFLILCFLACSSYAQNCPDYSFSNNNIYTTCNALPVLNSFLHWNYHQSNHTVDIAYRHTGMTTSNWVVWALNPSNGRMVGSQCLVALQNSSSLMHAYMSPVTDYGTSLQEGPLSFEVPRLGAEFRNGDMIIYATIQLPAGTTSFTHVWQYGDVSGNTPQSHQFTADNLRSFGTIDFATGAATGAPSGGSRNRNRNIHGVLNVVSWGIMVPIGAMTARYMKVFKTNPLWFYLHVVCQSSGYIVGVAGWATGIRLGSQSSGIQYNTHRNIGITIFVLGTIQVFALLLRPKPDHKYRFYWNIYHHSIGYSVIVLSIVNIFEGFDILDPERRWRNAYIGILIFLGACVTILEPWTWYIVLKRKKEESKQQHGVDHPANGVNGYSV